ncbi:hypothetical protein [Rhodococcus sp. IEGM 1374]|uniref:hypothetical protein n=1 Tax=Rhodococcus sp. IEGM 1374 TaxID=3082221 RepID=UPI002952C59D|nr:hypothetical protein [Rhodococcus sp. IEGM 1374]MDV7991638.1 hypothetical protein [Rhodococcus sp. IEGM 1374]
MGVDSQYSLQVWISDVADAVPNTAVLLIAVLVIIAVLTVWHRPWSRPRHRSRVLRAR